MESQTSKRSLLAQVECEVLEEGREWMRRRIERKLQKRVAEQGRISPLKRSGVFRSARPTRIKVMTSAGPMEIKALAGRRTRGRAGGSAWRGDPYEFGRRLYAEALRQGLNQAQKIYVVADGGVWIWNLVADRVETAAAIR